MERQPSVETADLEGTPLPARLVRVHRDLDIGLAPWVSEYLDEAESDGVRLVLVELCRAEFVDSTGYGVLFRAARRLVKLGGRLCVITQSDGVRRMLKLTGLTELLPCYATVEDALASGT